MRYSPTNAKRTEWHQQAACRKPWVDPAWFFGDDDPTTLDADTPAQDYGDNGLRARLICSACPVFRQCWEENRDAEFGIFAGTDEIDRKRMVATAQRRVDREHQRTGEPGHKVSIRDIPVPRFTQHLAAGSTRVQIALYAFLHGKTMAEASVVSELPLKTVTTALTGSTRYKRAA